MSFLPLSRRGMLRATAGGCAAAASSSLLPGCGFDVDVAPEVSTMADANGVITLNLSAAPKLSAIGNAALLTGTTLPAGGVIVARLSQTQFAAVKATCTHQACPLGYSADERLFACPCHGSRFYAEAVDGKCIGDVARGPAVFGAQPYLTSYDAATNKFVRDLLSDDVFMADCSAFCAQLGTYGATNGLAQTLLRVCSPGVPDTYQGAELWHQDFVDPDNRRPVDFARRRALLAEIRGEPDLQVLSQRLLAKWADGGIKLHVLRAALQLRARHRDLFIRGEYEPLLVDDHVVAFARSGRGVRAVTVVPRLPYRLTRGEQPWPVGAVWGDRQLQVPPGIYRDVLTGQRYLVSGTLGLAVLLEHLPVALLISEGETQ